MTVDWTDRKTMLGLILTLSFGFSILFFVSSDFLLASLFEFLGIATLIVGWFIVAPAYYFLTRSNAETEPTDSDRTDRIERATDPIEILQQRYANGDLSESEFEHKLNRLLETDDRTASDSKADFDHAREDFGDKLGRTRDRDRDLEYE